jgi:hypothetical protein
LPADAASIRPAPLLLRREDKGDAAMNKWAVFAAGMLGLAIMATDAGAQATDVDRADKARKEAGQPDAPKATQPGERTDAPAASTQTGGDEKPNAVDPAEATKTGGNAGEGASYSRSNEKGQSTTK